MHNNDEKKIRVVFGLPSLLVGGIERQLIRQLPHYETERYKLHIVTLFDYSGRRNLFDSVPKHVQVHRMHFSGTFDVAEWIRLFRLLKKINPDVVVSSMFSANTVFRIVSLFLGYKTIAREHNIYAEKTLIQRVVDRLLAYITDQLVAVSEGVADFTSRQLHIPHQRFLVIHNGIDIAEYRRKCEEAKSAVGALRDKFNIKENERVVLNVARLKPQKNQRLLIDAFKILLKNYPDTRLVIAGDGIEQERLAAYIKEVELEPSVLLVGTQDNIPAFYALAAVFALTSQWEGFPNVVIEAMACGVPVVATRVPGVAEFLKDGESGFLVEAEPSSVSSALARALILTDEERERMVRYARKSIERLDMQHIVRRYEDVISSVLRK